MNDPEAYRTKHSKSTTRHAITAGEKEMLESFSNLLTHNKDLLGGGAMVRLI